MFGTPNAQEHHVCTVAVGIVGDLTHALKDKLMVYCDEIMQKLLANLGNPNIERNVKPHIISCFWRHCSCNWCEHHALLELHYDDAPTSKPDQV
eukprot:TRINITY_DN7328_c0_g1_i1.p2 TRINITY_DN7328_c0_g1~~TRINITY_DN7328_c0_g1_i1.p2  ORF type:complete len:94 (+),score=15.67 TRINITY_DN7328_c0_g1_i1:118-399(+)